MDGTPVAGTVTAVDHDRWFKELLTTFFVESLDLFFPKLAASLDPNSLEFLNPEQFASLNDGASYRMDIVVKARFKGSEAFFIIHVEHQSTAPSTFPQRFFRYYAVLYEKYQVPVYPIVIYSHETPRKKQPSLFRISFPDGEVLRFQYRVVQLNRLSWRQFLNTPNPVASALMAKMRIAPRDRPKVKAECLRLMITLKLDPARMKLIGGFIDAYLRLNEVEEKSFQRAIGRADLPPEQREEIMEYVTSWEERGLEKGRQEGIEAGLAAGRQEGRQEGIEALRAVLRDLLVSRFGSLDAVTSDRLENVNSLEELQRLFRSAVSARSLQEVALS